MGGVVESDAMRVTRGCGEEQDQVRVDYVSVAMGYRRGVVAQCRHPSGQAPREDLLEFGQRGLRGVTEITKTAGGETQSECHGHGLIVVEKQRRQGRPGPQLVATPRPRPAVDGVAELAQLVDVVAQRAGAYLKSFRKVPPTPTSARLQQGEQPEQTRRRTCHEDNIPQVAARISPQCEPS